MSASISYAAPHPALSHLSITQILEMHARFMSGAKAKDLFVEYQVETTSNQIQSFLPLRILNDMPCPNCNAPMQQKWETKTNGMPVPFCKPCGHEQYNACTCTYCRNRRICKANREWSDKRVPYVHLTLKDKILLTALFLTHVDYVACVSLKSEVGAFAPSITSNERYLAGLWNSGAIVLATAPHWVVDIRRDWTFIPEEFGWRSNVTVGTAAEPALLASELLVRLCYDLTSGLEASDEAAVVGLMREVAEEYSYAYLDAQMDKQKLEITSESATRNVLRDLIEILPLADICAIGWQSAKDCGNAYKDKIATSRKHAANMLPGKMARLAEMRRLKPDAWKFERALSKVSRIERVLHDLLFGGQDTFFNWPLNRYYAEVVMPRLQGGRLIAPSKVPYIPPR